MHQKHWKFEQTEPTSTWQINNVPEGAEGAYITHVKTPDGRTITDFEQMDAPYGIDIVFGVEAESGIAYGDYYVADENSQVVGNGGVVNINVTQNNGGAASEPYNFPESTSGQD